MRALLRLLALWRIVIAGTMLDRNRQQSLLLSIMHGDAWPTVPAGWKMRLGSNAPTVTTNMTELTGTGYTAGGSTITCNSPTGASGTLPVTLTEWTNGSGGSWSVVGIEVWDTAGTPLRWLWGTWTGQPIPVANGNKFQVASGAVTADATAW